MRKILLLLAAFILVPELSHSQIDCTEDLSELTGIVAALPDSTLRKAAIHQVEYYGERADTAWYSLGEVQVIRTKNKLLGLVRNEVQIPGKSITLVWPFAESMHPYIYGPSQNLCGAATVVAKTKAYIRYITTTPNLLDKTAREVANLKADVLMLKMDTLEIIEYPTDEGVWVVQDYRSKGLRILRSNAGTMITLEISRELSNQAPVIWVWSSLEGSSNTWKWIDTQTNLPPEYWHDGEDRLTEARVLTALQLWLILK